MSDVNQETLRQVPSKAYLSVVQLSATRRGARLARLLAERQLADWGVPFADEAVLVVAELASNAVFHGRVPGRDFRLALRLDPAGPLRIEVTDARGDRLPRNPDPATADAESGRGLLLVTAYVDRWGVDEAPAGCKTVWAEMSGPDRRVQ
ncbi:ATP-binding protein [Streptomyces sp. KM273126]|uniref:ATP-binding protein n=1 Tax=Streptomyces sp. KM273126 TaxID=2545247 RepID=UPI001404BD47|nr:ATP-binding protein [Streptomyces sp. KM273126]MBA2806963.1 ATP-binding protein [Streptomyces sp. KM273126]